MKTDIILSGVGGQGIVSIAAVIGMAALENKLYLKQSEVHGMSQRGGSVQSHLRISHNEIASDLVPYGGADLIISVEPMEALRYLPYLKTSGWLITNTKPFINIPNYPEIEAIYSEIKKFKNSLLVNADEIASEIKSPKSSNIVMLGAASTFIDMPLQSFENGIRKIFGSKGDEIVQANIKALFAGRELSQKK